MRVRRRELGQLRRQGVGLLDSGGRQMFGPSVLDRGGPAQQTLAVRRRRRRFVFRQLRRQVLGVLDRGGMFPSGRDRQHLRLPDTTLPGLAGEQNPRDIRPEEFRSRESGRGDHNAEPAENVNEVPNVNNRAARLCGGRRQSHLQTLSGHQVEDGKQQLAELLDCVSPSFESCPVKLFSFYTVGRFRRAPQKTRDGQAAGGPTSRRGPAPGRRQVKRIRNLLFPAEGPLVRSALPPAGVVGRLGKLWKRNQLPRVQNVQS